MGDLVNLNRFRKAKARTDLGKAAEANRARFGRTKAEKSLHDAERDAAARLLDGARRDDD